MYRMAVLVVLMACTGSAAVKVFDFESAEEREGLPYSKRGLTTLSVVGEYATSGSQSLCFDSEQWRKGAAEWPSFELKPVVNDWSGYERLVIDITNTGSAEHMFNLYVTDSKVPFRSGLLYRFILPAYGYKRYEIPLSIFPDKVNRKDIALMHFFTERPAQNMRLYIDNISLVKMGESLPEPQAPYVKQVVALALGGFDVFDHKIAALENEVAPYCTTPVVKQSAAKRIAGLNSDFAGLRREVTSDALTLDKLSRLQVEFNGFSNRVERMVSQLRFQKATVEAGLPHTPMMVGVATPMEHVLPRGAPFECSATKTIRMRLAQNERESVQVVVVPDMVDLKGVRVAVSALKGSGGAVLDPANVECDVVGYVKTASHPPYKVAHVGWWPDPILNFIDKVDIAADDLQSFWVRIHAPAGQAPGVYRGKLTVSADNAPSFNFDLQVRVNKFCLPPGSSMPLAITFAPHDHATAETRAAQQEWAKSGDYPINAWQRHKLAWADMLADYGITYDSLYHGKMPDFEVLKHLKEQGRLGWFNLGYWYYFDDNDASRAKWEEGTLKRLQAAYEGAKEHGLLEHAYIYGCDEVVTNHFKRVEKAAAMIKAACPGVPIMTTTYDKSFGMKSGIDSVDIFCPLTPSFDKAGAEAARAAGRQVWWYICCGPHHPYANMFVEYPVIEARLLMGAMSARMRPDGFLYYQISIWNSEKPITHGPFTDWNPRSWTNYHGDGAWTCVGPDGKPLPTQRLENFRDGLEDFAYVKILDALVAEREGQGESEWLKQARAALAVPESLMQDMKVYSRDPQEVEQWRELLADLIESAPAEMVPLLVGE